MYISLLFLVCFGIANGHYGNIPKISKLEADIQSVKDETDSIYGAMDQIETKFQQQIQKLGPVSGTTAKPIGKLDFDDFEERLTILEDTVDAIKRYLMGEKAKDIELKIRSEDAINQINVKVDEAKLLVGNTKVEISRSVSEFEDALKSVNESAQRNMNVKGVIRYGGVGTSCSAGNDACVVAKSECREGRCQCEPGYSYDKDAQQCVATCKSYGRSFQSVRKRVIRGHNDDIVENVSFAECKQRCYDADEFVCRSIDYFDSMRECYLSSITKLDAEDDWEYNSIGYHFQRDCEQ